MAQLGHHVIHYCDDFLIIGDRADCQAAFDKLCSLLQQLGFKLSTKKLLPPTKEAVCLGISINTTNFEMKIPDEKFALIKDMCHSWATAHQCTKRKLDFFLIECFRYLENTKKENIYS